MKTRDREKESRDSILVMLLILLLGFICIILTSGWALRIAPSWKLPANMDSMLNPDNDFLTSHPSDFLEPLDPAILTNPAWMNVFLTPGASFSTLPPRIGSTNTSVPTNTSLPVLVNSPTSTSSSINTPIPTNTIIFIPPPPSTSTPKPPPPATRTPSSTPSPSADLQITKTDGSATYTPGNVISYTIVVSNAGPSSATGASVTDTIPASISGTTINCLASGTASCGTNASVGNNLSFTGVNIPVGAANFLTITVSGMVNPATTGNLVNTAMVTVGAGQTDPTPGNNSATDTDTPVSADLGITKTDNATDYEAGGSTTYTIVVTNNGPDNVSGAVVTDNIPAQISSWTWACSQTGGATGCDAVAGSSANFTDVVNLPNGASITYTVTASILPGATGPLTNTANVSVPVGYTDPVSGNDSDSDTDQLIVASSFPYGNIGTTPDCPVPSCVESILSGGYLTLRFGTSLVVGGHAGYDLVYYELPQGANPGIWMDEVILQIGDGSNWYTILDWGNTLINGPDTNTNIPVPLPSPPNLTDCTGEPDNCEIDASFLYNYPAVPPFTGVAIQLDGVVPDGAYDYIRIIAPPDSGDGVELDAIVVLP